jgi:hypothetical protein
MDGLANLQKEIMKYLQNQPINFDYLVQVILSSSVVHENQFDLLFDLIFSSVNDSLILEKCESLIYSLNEKLPPQQSLLFKDLLLQFFKNFLFKNYCFAYQYLFSKMLTDGFLTETDVDFSKIAKENLPIFLPYFLKKKMSANIGGCFQEIINNQNLEMLRSCFSIDVPNFFSILGNKFKLNNQQLTPRSELTGIMKADDIEAYQNLIAQTGFQKGEIVTQKFSLRPVMVQ